MTLAHRRERDPRYRRAAPRFRRFAAAFVLVCAVTSTALAQSIREAPVGCAASKNNRRCRMLKMALTKDAEMAGVLLRFIEMRPSVHDFHAKAHESPNAAALSRCELKTSGTHVCDLPRLWSASEKFMSMLVNTLHSVLGQRMEEPPHDILEFVAVANPSCKIAARSEGASLKNSSVFDNAEASCGTLIEVSYWTNPVGVELPDDRFSDAVSAERTRKQ